MNERNVYAEHLANISARNQKVGMLLLAYLNLYLRFKCQNWRWPIFLHRPLWWYKLIVATIKSLRLTAKSLVFEHENIFTISYQRPYSTGRNQLQIKHLYCSLFIHFTWPRFIHRNSTSGKTKHLGLLLNRFHLKFTRQVNDLIWVLIWPGRFLNRKMTILKQEKTSKFRHSIQLK